MLVVRAFLLAATPLAAAPASAAPLVVYVVRHAEKAGSEGDVPLSEAGAVRAEALARLLADVPLVAVHSTDTTRTRTTAAPTATSHHLEVQPYDPKGDLVKALRAAGGAHLVVGHSNTVPELVAALGGEPVVPMADTEFDRLSLVVVPDKGGAVTQLLRYGAPSAAPMAPNP